MQDGKSSHVMIRTVVNAARKVVPELVQRCPYFGHYEIINAKPLKELLVLSPTGVIRTNAKFIVGDKATVLFSFLIEISN
jgi:hypothetical protein